MTRIQDYFALNSQIAAVSDSQLTAMLDRSKTGDGWGSTHALEFNGKKIFAKKIAVTELEFEYR